MEERLHAIAKAIIEELAPNEVDDLEAAIDDLRNDEDLGAHLREMPQASGALAALSLMTPIVLPIVSQILANRIDRSIDAIVAAIRKRAGSSAKVDAEKVARVIAAKTSGH